MAQFLRKSVVADWWQFVRRYVPYSALALCCLATSVTAEERFGQWSLEFQEEGVVALKLKPIALPDHGFGAPEVAFVCNQESKYVVVIVAPNPGNFKINRKQFPLRSREPKTTSTRPTCCNSGTMKAIISLRNGQMSSTNLHPI